MIHGWFDEIGHLYFEIELITSNRLNLPVDAMLDTGFTGFLAMNRQDLEDFEWVYRGNEQMITARGEVSFERYTGKILFDGQEYEIPVFAGDELTEVLLGSQWLKILPLSVNYQAGILTLG
jgi:predicted aspartyl protease